MTSTLRQLLAEPAVPNPPKRVWRDWALIAILVPAAILDAVFRDDIVWRWFSLAFTLTLMPTLLFRRTHPLAMVAIAFGSAAVVDVVAQIVGDEWEGLNAMVFFLLLPYSLFRWASGRHAAIGLGFMFVTVLVTIVDEPIGDVIGGAVVVSLSAALGALARYEYRARDRDIEQAKLREREQLARELHDTVAHHVSAIAVQAQAGRALAGARPEAAVDALEVIEEEASRTLSEMRSMVGALRQHDDPDLAPQPGVADIERLAAANGAGPTVEVRLSGDLDDLRPTVGAAIYRLAQESITNAVRHAKRATRIDVHVAGLDDSVRLTEHDVGESYDRDGPAGYGLVGMSERAKLLGGTIHAGPNPDRGWTVDAVLPRGGAGS